MAHWLVRSPVQSLRFARYDRAGMCVIVIIVVTILIDYASGTIRRRIIEGPGGSTGAAADPDAAFSATGAARVDSAA